MRPDREALARAYRPSAEEVAYACRLVAAWERATAPGQGAFVLEGRVVDLPVVETERAVPARAGDPGGEP